MKGRSHRSELPAVPAAPATTAAAVGPAEDWVDGSWTVDCSCGVTFDDGEEMVSCDECGVWVHTRCSRFVRGAPSFACHKCRPSRSAKTKPARSGVDSSVDGRGAAAPDANGAGDEETEVAQLLAELPSQPRRFRRWAELPLHERVHVHGDPLARLFCPPNPTSAFTPALWQCTRYVPRKFGFQFKDFPSWDEKGSGGDRTVGADGENASIGAGMLFALSKDWDGMQKGQALVVLRTKEGAVVGKESSPARSHGGRGSKRHKDEKREGKKNKKKKDTCDADKKGGSADANGTIKSLQQQTLPSANAEEKEGLALSEDDMPKCHTKENLAAAEADDRNCSDLKIQLTGQGSYASRMGEVSVFPAKVDVAGVVKSEASGVASGKFSELKKEAGNQSIKVEVDAEALDHVQLGKNKHMLENEKIGVSRASTMKDTAPSNTSCSSLKNETAPVMPDGNAQNCGATIVSLPFYGEEANKLDPVIPLNAQQKLLSRSADKLLEFGANHSRSSEFKYQDVKSEADHETSQKLVEKTVASSNKFSESKEKVENFGSPLVRQRSCTELQNCSGSCDIVDYDSQKQSNRAPGEQSTLPSSNSVESSKPSQIIRRRDAIVTPFDGKDDSKKSVSPSLEASQGYSRRQLKYPPKVSIPSTQEPSQSSKTVHSSSKHRLPVVKEQFSKTSACQETEKKSCDGDVATLQPRTKAAHPNLHRKDKVNRHDLPPRPENLTHSTPKDLPASDVTIPLSDEQLALLLHQQLNSSPRVPRVPRVLQGAGILSANPNAVGSFSKRSFPAGGRDQSSLSKKTHKEDSTRHRPRSSGLSGETRRQGKVSSDEKSCEQGNKLSSMHAKDKQNDKVSMSSSEVFDMGSHLVVSGSVCTGLRDGMADLGSHIPPELPGVIEDMMNGNEKITYEELCDAIWQRWNDLTKSNDVQYSYDSCLRAVNECLRSRNEWAHLIDRTPKNSTKKHSRKVSDDATVHKRRKYEMDDQSSDSQHDQRAKRKRKSNKRRRLELQGRKVDIRRTSSRGSDSDEGSDPSSEGDESPHRAYKSKDNSDSNGHSSGSSSSSDS